MMKGMQSQLYESLILPLCVSVDLIIGDVAGLPSLDHPFCRLILNN